MAGPLENVVMRKCKINYAESRKLCQKARENLGIGKWSNGWTAELEAKCLELYNKQIDGFKEKPSFTSNASVDTKATKDLTYATEEMTEDNISLTESVEWATLSRETGSCTPETRQVRKVTNPIIRNKMPKSSFQPKFKYSHWARSGDTSNDKSISDISDITANTRENDSFSLYSSVQSFGAISENGNYFDSLGSSAWTLWTEDSRLDQSVGIELCLNSSESDSDEWETSSKDTILVLQHEQYMATEGQKDRLAPRLPQRVPSAGKDEVSLMTQSIASG